MPTRKTRHGYGYRARDLSSKVTHSTFRPIEGWSDEPDTFAPPGSMISGHNIWIEDGVLKPRSGLSAVGTTSYFTNDVSAVFAIPLGSNWAGAPADVHEHRIFGVSFAGESSAASFAYFNPGTGDEGKGDWSLLSLVSTAGIDTDYQRTGTEFVFGENVYVDRLGTDVFIFGSPGCGRLYAWQVNTPRYSYLTESPGPLVDMTLFDNSPILWGSVGTTGSTYYEHRVQWPVGSDPEDWTGIGSGAEDLIDVRGAPTRIFTLGDHMLLATTHELWRGRKIEGSFRFAFNPLTRGIGMPLKTAAIQTPLGVFWLNDDFMVYHIDEGLRINPIGQAILQRLRDEAYLQKSNDNRLFFSYDGNHRLLTLHYPTEGTGTSQGAVKALTYHLDSKVWTPQTFGKRFISSACAPLLQGVKGRSGFVQLGSVFGSTDGSVYLYSETTSLDYNVAKEAVWQSGGIFTGDNENMKLMTEIRVDARSDIASNLSISGSGNLGGAFATGAEFAISVQSNTSQTRVFPKVSGQYHQIKVTSEDTGWEISRIGVKGQILGKAL